MKKVISYKIMRKCLILVFMIAGLVFVVSNNKFTTPVSAAPCCEGCTGWGDPGEAESHCLIDCMFDPTMYGGTNFFSCSNNCISEANVCYSHCTYCGGGGASGGGCSSNSECNYNEFCGADG